MTNKRQIGSIRLWVLTGEKKNKTNNKKTTIKHRSPTMSKPYKGQIKDEHLSPSGSSIQLHFTFGCRYHNIIELTNQVFRL